MPMARVNGIDLFYDVVGQGVPLVLITGFGDNSLQWEPLLDQFAARFRVITLDNRGSGRSSVPPGPYNTRQMADDLAALLDLLNVDRAHIFGHSMGGMIGQELALAHPDRVDRLVLFASFARPRPAIIDPWLTFVVQATERGLDPGGLGLWGLPWVFSPRFVSQPDLIETALADILKNPYPTSSAGLAAQAEALRTHDTVDRLSSIKVPTLVLVGAEDMLTPPYYSMELATGIPNACSEVLERGGHAVLWEEPGPGIASVVRFLTHTT